MAEYHVENFGCRASRADGEMLSAQLRSQGLSAALHPAHADIVIANTCSVTAQADKTLRAYLRRVHKENPTARILVTGCYAQRAPQEVAALPGVHAVIGNSHKALVPDIASAIAARAAGFIPLATLVPAPPSIYVDNVFAHSELAMPEGGWASSESSQTRPNLKVQDGCGNRCSFCIIPTTRGHSRSLSLDASLRDVQAFTAGGGTELVLSGINLGRWGWDLTPRHTLEELVAAILQQTKLPRLRLSSVEPMDWTPPLLALFREHGGLRLARHAHLPLQSGSDTILRAMHRRYRPWHYAEKLNLIREALPQAAIGADVMVGFPGESDALFAESLAFIAAQPFAYLHLFPFSARPGTRAWQLAQQSPVASAVVTERMARLRVLIAEKNRQFRQGLLGHELPAVTLQTPAAAAQQAWTMALTDNFVQVQVAGILPANQNVRLRVTGLTETGLTGELAA